ncbi:hypothetical protein LOTGIDRAFT_152053 [Lottia gigantea]|uniref:DOMON domain-containing protein n=1 Tax=Lottia gigantea TaxID=225164 RepID=V4BC59_LOTGI|nr:hypothetical protein LOTGIDRAFT_152053 [Lottia gigantea]ESP05236.1 hypothetical protein LOTGIDRAFT_152053 [Lottia gigantea]
MWIILSLVFSCLPCITGHISLIYPPSRKYDFDFMDNLLTPGPCGVPTGLGPSTTLLAGSTINVKFHLAYPHKGGFFLEVMNNNTNAILRHPQSGVLSSSNTTLRSAELTLPNQECRGCWIRLVRQAAEWVASCRKGYVFWSCADVDIIQTGFIESCSGHGTWRNNKCECGMLWIGDRCEHKVDCKDASDCNDHGECVDIATDPNPIKHCYCQHGWHGIQCDKTSSVATKNIDYSLYKKSELSPDYMLFYRYIAISEEIEMVLKVNSSNWVAIGWRPQSFRSGCQLFPNLPNARAWSAGEDEVNTKETTPKPEGEAEATTEPESVPETPKPEGEVTSEPETEGEVTSEPETEGEVTSEPETEGQVTSEPEPETEGEVTSEPETEGEVTSEPETEGEVTSEPETEGQVTSEPEPETEAEVTTEPESEPERACGSEWSTGCTNAGCTYKASWTYDSSNDEINFVLESTSTTSWLAIGFSDDQLMPGSDAFYGFYENNQLIVKDAYLAAKQTPTIDGTQNVVVVNGAVTNGILKIEVKRARNTGDSADKSFTDSDCYYFLYAMGTVNSGSISYHSKRWISTEKICIKACAIDQSYLSLTIKSVGAYVVTTPKPEGEAEATTEPESVPETPEPEVTSEPETEGEVTSEPETEGEVTSEPETEGEVTSEPETEGEVTSEPETEGEVTSEPETEGEVTSEPETESEVTSEPETEVEVTSEPETEGEVTSEPETEGEVTSEPETESEVTYEPETEGEVTSEPESEGGTKTCQSPLPELGYSSGGRIVGTNDRNGNAPRYGMDCSDIIVGTARGETSRIGDYYSRDRSTPKHDSVYGGEDSLTAALGFENDGQTVIVFRRKVQAFHRSDHTIEKGIMSVIWAHGQIEDSYRHNPESGDKPGFYAKDQLLYHGASPNRGTASINFLESARDLSTSCNGNWPTECDNCDLEVSWVYNEDTDDISFTMKARLNEESKWIGVGFSKDKNMANSDAIIGWVDNGQVHVSDRWMTGQVQPQKDAKDDIKNKRGIVENGVTTITFDRARDTGDSSDLAFTDNQCLYMFYAVGGGYKSSDESITKHGNTPTVSSSKICIRSCDVVASGTSLISTVEVTFNNQYDSKLSDRASDEFKNLERTMKEWMDMVFKSLPGYLETKILQFKQGSIIVVADVESIRDSDSVSNKAQYKTDIESLLQRGQSSPPQGYTITGFNVGNPRSVQAPKPFRLTLIEEIVIGLTVSLVIVIVIVAVCKLSETQREKKKAAASNKHQRFNGDSSSGSSTTSLSNQKPTLDYKMPAQGYTNAGYNTTLNSSNGTQRSTITYDEFIKTKNIP